MTISIGRRLRWPKKVGVDATDLLRSYFARRHLEVDRFKSLTPEQETKFQRWLKAHMR